MEDEQYLIVVNTYNELEILPADSYKDAIDIIKDKLYIDDVEEEDIKLYKLVDQDKYLESIETKEYERKNIA